MYKPDKKYNIPKRTTIGKKCEDDSDMMYPNPNFLTYFPDAELPEDQRRNARSSCLRIGTWLVMLERPNYMNVPAAIRELEKIELIRQADGVYRLEHAVTATQKTILKAFGIDANYVKRKVREILAAEIDQFSYDYDTYQYRDMADDSEAVQTARRAKELLDKLAE